MKDLKKYLVCINDNYKDVICDFDTKKEALCCINGEIKGDYTEQKITAREEGWLDQFKEYYPTFTDYKKIHYNDYIMLTN